MPRSTRSSSSGGSAPTSPLRNSSSNSTTTTRVTRSKSARTGPVTVTNLSPLREERRHSDGIGSPLHRTLSLELVPFLPTPTMTSANPSPEPTAPSHDHTPPTPSTAESALHQDRSPSPTSSYHLQIALEQAIDDAVQDTVHTLCDRDNVATSSPSSKARTADVATGISVPASTTVASSTAGMQSHPCISGSGSTSTLETVCSGHTRAQIPLTAFEPHPPPHGPTTPLVTSQTYVPSKKLIFLHPPMTNAYEFATAIRRYVEDEHINNILPLRDGTGYQIVCDTPRTAERILKAPIPPILRGCHVRPPRPRNVTPSTTQEIIIHQVPLDFQLADIQAFLEQHYGVRITYKNRLHRRTADGTLDFTSPIQQVRLRLSPADMTVITQLPRVQIHPTTTCPYTVTRTVYSIKQCFRCYKFGHTTPNCKNTPCCIKCGSPGHVASDCPQEQPNCVHCQKAHFPTYKGCQTYRSINSREQTYAQVTKQPHQRVFRKQPIRPLMDSYNRPTLSPEHPMDYPPLPRPTQCVPSALPTTSSRPQRPPITRLRPNSCLAGSPYPSAQLTVPPPPLPGQLTHATNPAYRSPAQAPPEPRSSGPSLAQQQPPPPRAPTASDPTLTAPLHQINDAWNAINTLIQRHGATPLYCAIAHLLLQALPHHV